MKIDLDYILKHAQRPTEEYVEQKIEFENCYTKTRYLTKQEKRVQELDVQYAKYAEKVPAVGKIADATNLPLNSVSKILDKIEDYMYYKYLSN